MNYTITIDYRQNRLLVEALCNYMALRMPGVSIVDLFTDELLEQAAKQYVEDRYSKHEDRFRQYKLADKIEDFKALRGVIYRHQRGQTNQLLGELSMKDFLLDQLIIAAIAAALLGWPLYIHYVINGAN